MIPAEPSHTAHRVALRRAAHQLLDQPAVLSDPLAIPILGPETAQALRANPAQFETSRVSPYLRAFMAARARFTEDQLAHLSLHRHPPVRDPRRRARHLRVSRSVARAAAARLGGRLPVDAGMEARAPRRGAHRRAAARHLRRRGLRAPGAARCPRRGGTSTPTRARSSPGSASPSISATRRFGRRSPTSPPRHTGWRRRGVRLLDRAAPPVARRSARCAPCSRRWSAPRASRGRAPSSRSALIAELRELGFAVAQDVAPDEINGRYLAARTDGLKVGGMSHLMWAGATPHV